MNEWTWRLLDAAGNEMVPAESTVPVFSSQADAESWVGEQWPDLLAAGVESVTLLGDGEIIYAAMSLRPAPE